MIDWKTKLGSRKFWALIAGLTTSIGAIVGLSDNKVAQIIGIIGAVGSVAVYILGEAYVDGKAAANPIIIEPTDGDAN
jgi:multisubunit Na+/H+ antiporter MnhC subunit